MLIDTTKPVDRTGNTWCGPLVAAAILGTSTGVVADAVYNMRKARDPACHHKRVTRVVRGTYASELHALLKAYGYSIGESVAPIRYQPARRFGTYIRADGLRMCRAVPILSTADWHRWTMVERRGAWDLWRCLKTLGTAGTFIIETPGHWALLSGGHWCETFTKGAWVPARGAPKQSRNVLNAWPVSRN